MECNNLTREDLYDTIKGMSPWERMKLVDEFIHDASDLAFSLDLGFRQFVQQHTRHMGEYDERDGIYDEDCDEADYV